MLHKKEKTKIIIILISVIIFVLIIGPNVTIKKVNQWTCSYTGSQKGNTIWIGFITVAHWEIKSPFEHWLQEKNKEINHNWVKTIGTSYSLFGCSGRVHAQAPPIYPLVRLPELQEQFIKTSTDEEIEAFLKALNSGKRIDQEKIVREILRNYFFLYPKKVNTPERCP